MARWNSPPDYINRDQTAGRLPLFTLDPAVAQEMARFDEDRVVGGPCPLCKHQGPHMIDGWVEERTPGRTIYRAFIACVRGCGYFNTDRQFQWEPPPEGPVYGDPVHGYSLDPGEDEDGE